MKITKEDVKEFVIEMAGDDVPSLIDLLWRRRNVSEFKLAEKLNITVNQVRNMLYRLSDLNLVSFTRRKDKKKGWYIYYWTLEDRMVKVEYIRFKEKKLEEFRQRLIKEQNNEFYVCPNRCMRFSYGEAMENDFHCPECGDLVGRQDNERTIENLKRMIEEMEEELEQLKAEKEKQDQRRIKRLIKEEEKLKQERLAKRREAAAKRRAENEKKKKSEEKKKGKKKKTKKKAVKKKGKKKAVKKKTAKKKSPSKKSSKKKTVKKKPSKKKKVVKKKKTVKREPAKKKKAVKKKTAKKKKVVKKKVKRKKK